MMHLPKQIVKKRNITFG